MEKFKCIDSHTHCGPSGFGVKKEHQPISRLLGRLQEAHIDTCCVFADVVDIYDRTDPNFVDSEYYQKRRKRANEYLLDLSKRSFEEHKITMFPYYFVWNDFCSSSLDDGYKGVKWHRHSDEPKYNYDSPKCEEFLQNVYKHLLPIVYEEELENTINFAKRINGRTILIIPHLGMFNGGYKYIKKAGIWDYEYVYSDLSLAPKNNIIDFVKNYGSKRLLFGSDFPFGQADHQKKKLLSCEFEDEDLQNICFRNIERLMKVNHQKE